ncbi:oxygenase MpaB family protein [Streptomyces sp. ICBB 8177]|uniref:oxygenase MpaB family protein n=1 Tax=Streptomyces sp. ICBB 8177 TaxID=563922 RepID=UPI000D67B026|nr:oxygenase MpaB family protein [Streptomyces sp. ICBB 8177]PWI41758.1 hypothetical protein CK485_23270 [Streptomyces sp. ICBB 8177]
MRDADPGLFGPDSVTWQLHGDPMMWVAGVRALYLQALHPRAVRGVLQNSDFRADPWGRLMRTADYVGVITYGTTLQAERAAARIRGVHRRLTGTDPDTGARFAVDAPDLLLWVHCAEIDSYLDVARRSGFPLTPGQADTYVAEQREAARLVGLDPADVPGDTGQLAAYFDKVRSELDATREAFEVFAFIQSPPVRALLAPARDVLWRRAALLAYDSLPPFARELYGRPAPAEAAVDRALRATGAGLRAIPAALRWQLPPARIVKAVGRLGPGTHPSAYRLRQGRTVTRPAP